MSPKILVMPGSLRTDSVNVKLADVAQLKLAQLGADVTRISLADYAMPIVNEDLKNDEGIPENAMKLGRMIAAQDGILIVSPEYNGSTPPLLKNAIDWISLISKDGDRPLRPWRGKYVALAAASPGAFGGMRNLIHLRSVMVNIGSQVISEQSSVSRAHEAFNEDGTLKDERSSDALERTCKSLIDHCLRHAAVH